LAPRAELRKTASAREDFEAWQNAFRIAKPQLEDYDNRRWVAVHVANGIFALIPSDLETQVREALITFLKRDLFYFDYSVSGATVGADGAAASVNVEKASALTGLDISIVNRIDDPEKHFLGVAKALSEQPNGFVREFLIYDDPADAQRLGVETAKLQLDFADEYRYADYGSRYKIDAVSRRDLARQIRRAVSEAYNKARSAGKLTSLEAFTRQHVTFSSADKALLARSLTTIGWLIHKDYDGRRPAYEAIRRERSMRLAAGLLDAELIRKLDEAKDFRVILSAMQELMSDVDLIAVQLWESEMSQRWFHRSA